MSLSYSAFDQGHTPLPPPRKNGGLYTGKEFDANAPHRSFYVPQDSSYMLQMNLRSAKPPPGATLQPPGSIRPGNSGFDMPTPHLSQLNRDYNVFCIRPEKARPPPPEPICQSQFSQYFHL
jgi:hypothetical protein